MDFEDADQALQVAAFQIETVKPTFCDFAFGLNLYDEIKTDKGSKKDQAAINLKIINTVRLLVFYLLKARRKAK